jgi:hypothetical protein
VRIDASSRNEEVHVSVYMNVDGVVAVQVINNSADAMDVELTLNGGKGLSSPGAILTDNENVLKDSGQITAGKNGAWERTVPARSMVSLVGL